MSWFSGLLGSGIKDVGEGVKTALNGAGTFLNDVRALTTGKEPELDAKIAAAIEKINEAQSGISLAETQSSSLFVAGWRPAVGWLCVFALSWYYFVGPMAIFFLQVFDIEMTMPTFDLGELISLLIAMLGMSGIRSYDKKQGTSS
jgi:Holin of 3TMs, for gene-transfer release